MANNKTRPLSRVKPATLFAAVAVGAVAATSGIAAPAAYADTNYPTWDEVQKAKQNEASKRAQIESISGLLTSLQDAAAASSKTSQKAAEAYRVTLDKLDAAIAREAALKADAKAAQASADTSKMRAGLIAAHLARSGAQDLSVKLFLDGGSADDLLQQLGTASKLSEQSATIYETAVRDKNAATSLGEQAKSAAEERTRLVAESKLTFDAASAAAQKASAAYDNEQKKSNELYEQLAVLKDSTADAERAYREGQDAEDNFNPPPVTPPPPGTPPAGTPPTVTPPTVKPPTPGTPTPPSGGGNGGGNTGGGGGGTVAPPNASAVDTAMAFARAQIGDWYQLGGAGPNVWDCSGLTRAAYGEAGVYIGSHSATNQYRTMANAQRLVPFSQAQVGDLVFWGGNGDYYHVALYVGGGQILEAPDVGKQVRIHSIWGWDDVAPYVGRPTG
ncbi:C40 family peptidase [Glaciibacter psychrotolerans]|uniref:Cell wall-associated NlpC family hydrolase n=1 Tax=Glaciibacter psychrotolerans TaxID=670054 RepID=A0A7Z0J806_9MICO|nr:C40 family peptidase [Leifsonia psychrotolerans]NYJ21424.1 cell wall-associated NlpC family hydrolase [Leifsonia psychrotolerans]